MFAALQMLATAIALLLIGMAIGAGWICTIAAPNYFYDNLDGSRANTQVRGLLLAGSTPIAGLLLGGAAAGMLSGAYVSGVVSTISAIGFFFNRWTLAPIKKGDRPAGARHNRSGQRIVAVGLSLVFLLVAVTAAVLLILGI
ncbi:MAG: hypothetical protein AAF683_09055 [Pseudomonadota bacterium]